MPSFGYWYSMVLITDIEDILIVCVDGLNRFDQVIEAVYRDAEIQHCIIHQIQEYHKIRILQRYQRIDGRS